MKGVDTILETLQQKYFAELSATQVYQELAAVVVCYVFAFIFASFLRKNLKAFQDPGDDDLRPIQFIIYKLGQLLFPLTAIILLKLSLNLIFTEARDATIIQLAFIFASLLLLFSFSDLLIRNSYARKLFLLVGIPLLFFHLIGVLDDIAKVLDSMALEVGNIRVSVYSAARVLIFGSLLFWLGRLSNSTGKKMIRNQASLDVRTKEVFTKLFEIGLFFLIFLLLLQVMGINLTTLAVFGGAVGVGLGFGLQSIASNFISGLIILLDRSVSIGDFIELEDGQKGRVTELSLRSTTLETYDGRDIVVPNEKFITSSFINWTHKDTKQRYRVDFSVAYHSDIRKLVDIIKEAVAEHPQVISGEDIPFEERPDCEIDSFGDSGINMFVEFWMEGIDDGKNRVGGDLLLTILETIREHGFEIPFPQREVRILKSDQA